MKICTAFALAAALALSAPVLAAEEQLLAGADAMKGEHRREGFEQVVRALDQYVQFFDHPGLKKR